MQVIRKESRDMKVSIKCIHFLPQLGGICMHLFCNNSARE